MKRFYKAVVCTTFLLPITIQAEGLGVYVPLSIYAKSNITLNPDNTFVNDRNVRSDYDPSVGLGVMYDTNVGENKLFNYRGGLEYLSVGVENSSRSNKRVDFVNTFGFGIIRNEIFRFWIGPRINIAWNTAIGGVDNTNYALEIGVALATGINIELTREMVLGFDIDYREAYLSGTWDSDASNSGGSFYGDIEGSTARIYMIYMFGETFAKPMK